MAKNDYPCDYPDDNGKCHCPYEDTYTGYSDEMCRVCCGCGVDEDSYPEEEFESYEDPEEYEDDNEGFRGDDEEADEA